VSYLIYLPPDYDRDTTQRYPVVYWLHGGGGNIEKGGAFVELVDGVVRAGKVPAMIVVLVNGLKSMYVDSVDGKQPVESVIIKDLIPHVDETYRTISTREGRGIEGFSMGGYGAAHLGFKYPELFGVVSNLSGALVDWDFFSKLDQRSKGTDRPGGKNTVQQIFGTRENFDENHPSTLAKKNADAIRGRTFVRIVVGEADRRSFQANKDLHVLLDRLQIHHEFVPVPEVRHNYQTLYEVLGNDRGFEFFRRAFEKVVQGSSRR
jgi:endo-1,4-beta-xylanase